MKPKILLDIDGVIANFYYSFAKYLNEKHRCTLDLHSDPPEYDIKKWNNGVNELDIHSIICDWVKDEGFSTLSAFDGASNFFKKIDSIYDIYIVTARIGDWQVKFPKDILKKIKKDTIDWLKENEINCKNIYFEHDKVKFCKDNEITIMIEDKLSTVLAAIKEGINAILIDMPYNQYFINDLKINRAKSYNDVFKLLKMVSDI